MQHIYSWLTFEEMSADISEEVDRLVSIGVDRQAAVIRAATLIAMNRDRLGHPCVAVGLVELILAAKR